MEEIANIITRLEHQRDSIERAIAALREISGGKSTAKQPTGGPGHKKNRLSPEGRRRIAEAARRYWAAKRAGQAKAAPGAKKTGRVKRLAA